MKNVLQVLLAVSAMLAIPASAQKNTWTIDPVHTQATFQARHLSITTIRGSISKVAGTVEWVPDDPSHDSVVATLEVKTVNTRLVKVSIPYQKEFLAMVWLFISF